MGFTAETVSIQYVLFSIDVKYTTFASYSFRQPLIADSGSRFVIINTTKLLVYTDHNVKSVIYSDVQT